jgi:hypothetical protein
MSLPTTTSFFHLLTLTPPTRLMESLSGDLVQSIILDAKFASARPKVTAVPDDANVERVRGVTGAREAVRGFARGEAVKADELHEETCVASRSRSVAVPSVTAVTVAVTECEPPGWWGAVPRERVVRIAVVHWHVTVAHLRCERTTATAHKAVPAKVGHLERRHLPRDLDILRNEQDDRPDELEC